MKIYIYKSNFDFIKLITKLTIPTIPTIKKDDFYFYEFNSKNWIKILISWFFFPDNLSIFISFRNDFAAVYLWHFIFAKKDFLFVCNSGRKPSRPNFNFNLDSSLKWRNYYNFYDLLWLNWFALDIYIHQEFKAEGYFNVLI